MVLLPVIDFDAMISSASLIPRLPASLSLLNWWCRFKQITPGLPRDETARFTLFRQEFSCYALHA